MNFVVANVDFPASAMAGFQDIPLKPLRKVCPVAGRVLVCRMPTTLDEMDYFPRPARHDALLPKGDGSHFDERRRTRRTLARAVEGGNAVHSLADAVGRL